jgi:hypothetical protein
MIASVPVAAGTLGDMTQRRDITHIRGPVVVALPRIPA